MISMEGREEARITPMVLSSQQGLQWSPGKCSFFPVERLWITHRAPLRLGLLLRAWQFLEAFAARCFCLSVPLLGFLTGAFKGFSCNLFSGKANPKEPPQKLHSGCACEYKMSGNLPSIKNHRMPWQWPTSFNFILYKVIFSVCCSIQTLKKSKSLLFNSGGKQFSKEGSAQLEKCENWHLMNRDISQQHLYLLTRVCCSPNQIKSKNWLALWQSAACFGLVLVYFF